MLNACLVRKRSLVVLCGAIVTLPSWANVLEQTEEYVEDSERIGESLAVHKGNWVAAPMPISNPTLGTGLQAVVLYLHPSRDEGGRNATTGIGGLYTDRGSKFGGVFHQNYLAEDRFRITAAAGTGVLRLRYFGPSEGGRLSENPLEYDFNADILFLQGQVRLPRTERWYLGPTILTNYAQIEWQGLNLGERNPDGPSIGVDVRTQALGLVLAYDTRNDNYYPTKGIEFQTRWADYTGEAIGNLSYAKYSSSANFYIAATDEITVALRANFQGSYGDVPFYDLPNLDIRGYNRARFSDKFTLSLHAEARYMFSARWGVVGFIDGGWANDSVDGLLRGQAGSSFGSGLRWKVLESKSLHLGLDAAVSKDDAVVFIQIGEKF